MRDGAAISAIHPAMQLPIVIYLAPTALHDSSRVLSPQLTSEDSLHTALRRIVAADFFDSALAVEADDDEDTKLRELLLQQKRDNIHGKMHFFALPHKHMLLLRRRKNEAPVEQRLLEWVNSRTKRHAPLPAACIFDSLDFASWFICLPTFASAVAHAGREKFIEDHSLWCICMQASEGRVWQQAP